MKITDLELKCFIKRIEKKYPNKISCFFYDKKIYKVSIEN